MKHKYIRISLFVLEAFVALSAIAGGFALLIGAITVPVEGLRGSPFVDFTIPALLLMVVVGGSMLLAAVTIISRREIGVLISVCAGLAMMIFEIVEVAILDRTSGSALVFAIVLQVLYFSLGLAIFTLSSSLWMTEYRSLHFPGRHISHA